MAPPAPTPRFDTVAAALRHVEARLRAAGVATPASDARWLIEAVTGLAPSLQALRGHTPLGPAERRRLARLTARRARREPLQLVLGAAEFHGLTLRVRRGVLVPRPETEALVEHVLGDVPADAAWRLLDVGCGSGAVALALARRRPRCEVIASDVDPAAVRLARANARALALPLRVHRADLLDAPRLRAAARRAHVLVANLPYLPDGDRGSVPEELAWDGDLALFAGPDGLRLARRLRAQAWRSLPRGAIAWWELDPRNAVAFADEARRTGWREVRLAADLTGRRRFVRFVR